MGTASDPYDATRNGPLCPSAGTTSEDADRIRSTNITDLIVDLAEGSLVRGLPYRDSLGQLSICRPLTVLLQRWRKLDHFE